MRRHIAIVAALGLVLTFFSADAWSKTPSKKKKKKKVNIVKVIDKKVFVKALLKLAEDERLPIASSTLVEKGRGVDYYAVDKMLDENPETFWAEGAKGWGKNEWVAFHLPEGSTHIEISPGAGTGEQFKNFNRPKELYLDVYAVKLKRDDDDAYKATFNWKGRTGFKFKDRAKILRKKIKVKLPELVSAQRTMYVGVLIIRSVYKGQFDDTSISMFRVTTVWGED